MLPPPMSPAGRRRWRILALSLLILVALLLRLHVAWHRIHESPETSVAACC
jgi:multidrug resistance efflux pump